MPLASFVWNRKQRNKQRKHTYEKELKRVYWLFRGKKTEGKKALWYIRSAQTMYPTWCCQLERSHSWAITPEDNALAHAWAAPKGLWLDRKPSAAIQHKHHFIYIMQTLKCIWIPHLQLVQLAVTSMHREKTGCIGFFFLFSFFFSPREWTAAKIHRECMKQMRKKLIALLSSIKLYFESKAS